MRSVGIVELEAESGLAQQDPDRQICQQAGEPDAHRQPNRENRHQQNACRRQQDEVQLVRVHGRPLVASVG